MNAETRIDYDKPTNRFRIYTPMWMLDKVRAIPNRRFDDGRKCWSAPAIRMNVQYLRAEFPYSRTQWTDVAKKAAEEVANPPKREIIPFPTTYVFKTKPKPKQLEALDHCWSLDTPALFMAMGSGKTKVAIDLHSARYLAGQIDAVIVLCPVSIKKTWARWATPEEIREAYDTALAITGNEKKAQEAAFSVQGEIQKHSPIPNAVITVDTDKKNGMTVHQDKGGLKWFIVGLESIQSSTKAVEMTMKIAKSNRCAIVVDESSKIKNPQATRAKRAMEIGRECKYRLIMTGTSVTQGIIDLYMQFEFLDPQIIGIGDGYSFRNRYCVMGGYENKVIQGYQNVDELMDIIRPNVFQVTKEEANPELPPKLMLPPRLVQMTGEQKRIYKEVKAQLVSVIGGREVTAKNVLDKMRLLQQVECGFYSADEEDEFDGEMSRVERVIEGRDPKIEEMLSVLEDSPDTESVIVWCRYRNQLRRVVEALRNEYGPDQVVEFHGGCDEDQREEAKQRFQGRRSRFIVATQACGGMGQTWTAATLVIYMSNTFSLEDREQSEDRAHRIGQENKVKYVDIACEGTVGVYVISTVSLKRDFANYVKEMLKRDRNAVVQAA